MPVPPSSPGHALHRPSAVMDTVSVPGSPGAIAPTGLRMLSLPTVGATQAAADAAVAAMNLAPTRRFDPMLSKEERADTRVDSQRTRYFRRLSALPPPPVHAPVLPTPLLKFVDAIRGILFSLSQIYAALQQHICVSTDESVAAQFQRPLGVSDVSLTMLIGALDKFDVAAQRGVPEPPVLRFVLDACQESVRTFQRMVAMLHMQLSQLEQSVDVRFTRTLLLMLYGSVAEIRNSAAIMSPQMTAVMPYLAQDACAEQEGNESPPSLLATPLSHARSAKHKGGSISSIASLRAPHMSPSASWKVSPRIGAPSPSAATRTPKGPVRSLSGPCRAGAPEPSAIDAQLYSLLNQVTDSSLAIWHELHTYIQSSLQQDTSPAQPGTPTGTRSRRLRDVDEMCKSTMELTSRLQGTMARFHEDAARNAAAAPDDAQQLWEEANHFVRAIIHISTLIKAVAANNPFPRELMRRVGELNHGCSTLAAELLRVCP